MAIKPKYGNCSKCNKENILLYRRKPKECKYCYLKGKQKIYAKRQKERQVNETEKRQQKPLKHTKKRINQVSKTNKIKTSSGEVMSRSEFDNRIRRAKAKKIQIMLDKYGYIFCEDCNKNSCKPIDCSHDKSVKSCIEDGVAELAYSVKNITMRGRECHNIYDKTNLKA